jgi:membrane protein YqaA with SNARE-associated domain
VLFFPEGTRSTDGTIHGFRGGAEVLAAEGVTVVPVGVAGTGEVLPKGSVRPHPNSVAVVFGEPIPAGSAPSSEMLRERVAELRDEAEDKRNGEPRHLFARLRRFAVSRAAIWFVALWASAEALAWPIVPDLLILFLVLAAPRRWASFVAAAIVGVVVGGAAAMLIGSSAAGPHVVRSLPLVTDRMVGEASSVLGDEGAAAVLGQPLSGIPYKVFAYEAGRWGVGAPSFLAASAYARGLRFLAVAGVGVLLAALAGRAIERAFPVLSILYLSGFAFGLARVVQTWS